MAITVVTSSTTGRITGDKVIDYGDVTITVMTTNKGTAYTLVTNVAHGACDETLIYPNGITRTLDVKNPADAAMATVVDYLNATYA